MLEKSDIQKMFLVMQARYGHKWTSNFDDPEVLTVAVSEWHRGLKRFPVEWLARGLETWNGAWPPSLPEFQRACMPSPDETGYDIRGACMEKLGLDDFALRRMNKDEVRKLFARAERELLEDYYDNMLLDAEAVAKALMRENKQIEH